MDQNRFNIEMRQILGRLFYDNDNFELFYQSYLNSNREPKTYELYSQTGENIPEDKRIFPILRSNKLNRQEFKNFVNRRINTNYIFPIGILLEPFKNIFEIIFSDKGYKLNFTPNRIEFTRGIQNTTYSPDEIQFIRATDYDRKTVYLHNISSSPHYNWIKTDKIRKAGREEYVEQERLRRQREQQERLSRQREQYILSRQREQERLRRQREQERLSRQREQERLRRQREQEKLRKQREEQEILSRQREQEILRKQREQQEILRKQREQQEILSRQREQYILSRQREEQEILSRQREQERLRKQREQQEILSRQREQERLSKQREKQEILNRQREEQEQTNLYSSNYHDGQPIYGNLQERLSRLIEQQERLSRLIEQDQTNLYSSNNHDDQIYHQI